MLFRHFSLSSSHVQNINAIKFALGAISLGILMLGFSYASVPLYQLYCQATGFGGTVQRGSPALSAPLSSEKPSDSEAPSELSIWIHFNADTSDNLPWSFQPTLNRMLVYPGDTALAFYTAQNKTNEPISGISTYHVTPAKAGIYFNKIQCFCFEEQRLKGGESIEMPILFFLDPDFNQDPKMKDVDSITLSYTFYRSSFG